MRSEEEISRLTSANSARALAEIITATKGAPRARAWIPGKVGNDARVYIGDVGYFTVQRTEVRGHKPTPLSPRLTMPMQGLFPSQRRALAVALQTYAREYVPRAMLETERLFQEGAQTERSKVLDAVKELSGDRGTTVREVARFTGVLPIRVLQVVRSLHEEGELLARGLGTAQEKILI